MKRSAVSARAVSGRASALHELAKTDIDAFYAEFPAGDRDYVVRHAQENVTSADVENLLKQLIARRMETEKVQILWQKGHHGTDEGEQHAPSPHSNRELSSFDEDKD